MSWTIEQIVDRVVEALQAGYPCSAGWHLYKREQLISYVALLSSLTSFTVKCAAGDVVEIGCDAGMGSLALGHGLAAGGNAVGSRHVYSIDIRPVAVTQTAALLVAAQMDWVKVHLGTSADVRALTSRVALAFIDGKHSYEACRDDLLALAPLMSRVGEGAALATGGVILCHDFTEPRPGMGPEVNGVRQAVAEFTASGEWSAVKFGGFALISQPVAGGTI